MIFKGYIFGIGYALICLLLSFALYKLGVSKKYTRKVVHILVGFEWIILYRFFGAGLHFLSVCVLFLILLIVAYKGKLMPMIASDSDNAPGTVYYAAAMTGVAIVGCFVPKVMLPFGIGVICTSLGDGLAGTVGQLIKKNNPKLYGEKTLFGALTNFVVSSASAFVISSAYSMELSLINCLLIGLLSAELELVTPYGLDNISVTWGVTSLTYAFMFFDGVNSYIAPIILTPLIIIFAIKKRALTPYAILGALVLDIAVSIAFGNDGFLILFTFFALSIIADKIKKQYKNGGRSEDDECGYRNFMQVLANGMIAFLCAVFFIATQKQIFIIPFITSLAEALSDTVASGIGALSKNTYDPFRRKKCENGMSGGMSVLGTFASLISAFILALLAYLLGFEGYGFTELAVVTVCAFLGAVFDSFLGSLVQVKYKCVVCNKVTEREVHCSKPTVNHSGISFIDNDIVNLLSCAFSALLSVLVALLL